MASEYGIVCENAFCACETVESEYVSVAGRRFCCIACAEDWVRHNAARSSRQLSRRIGQTAHGRQTARSAASAIRSSDAISAPLASDCLCVKASVNARKRHEN
jgi:hypothetical protein